MEISQVLLVSEMFTADESEIVVDCIHTCHTDLVK